jgi:hypothetical protein
MRNLITQIGSGLIESNQTGSSIDVVVLAKGAQYAVLYQISLETLQSNTLLNQFRT